MAVATLAGGDLPVTKVVSGVGASAVQRFNLPARTRRIRVRGSGAISVQFTGADGAAVSSDAVPVAANTWMEFTFAPKPSATPFVCVSAATGTATVYVVAEGG